MFLHLTALHRAVLPLSVPPPRPYIPHHTRQKMVHSLDRADLMEATFPDVTTRENFKLYLKH